MKHSILFKRNNMVINMIINILLLLFFFIAGCNGSGGGGPAIQKPEDTYNTGTFIDSPVYGLQYTSITWTGITDPNGNFYYQDGEYITFSIGDIIIGRTLAKPIITPLDLDLSNPTTSSTTVLNISRFLITLDKDSDPTNGITITQEVRDALKGVKVDLTDPKIDNSTGIKQMFSKLNSIGIYSEDITSLVPEDQALIHLEDSLTQIAAEDEAISNTPLEVLIKFPFLSVIMTQGQSLDLGAQVKYGKAPYTFSWRINDGKPFSSIQNPGQYTFGTINSYMLYFSATDSQKVTKTDSRKIYVFDPKTLSGQIEGDTLPLLDIVSPDMNSTVNVGDSIDIQATLYNGNLPIYLGWSTNHISGNPIISQNERIVYISSRTFLITRTVTFTTPGSYWISVFARDTGVNDSTSPDDCASTVCINVK